MASEQILTTQAKEIILLKASKGYEDPYIKALSTTGFKNVNFVPVLHYEYVNMTELYSAFQSKDRFSGIVFTSQTAVEACLHALAVSHDGVGVSGEWKHLPVFVVGKATSKAVERLSLRPTGSFSGNADALSKYIIEYFEGGGFPSRPLLFPCGNLRRETLPRAMEEVGIPLQCLVCYNTVAHQGILENLKQLQVGRGEVWVVFFSPSGVNFALQHVKSLFQSRLKVAAIGSTTAESLSKAEQTCDAVAQQPTPDSLAAAITQHS